MNNAKPVEEVAAKVDPNLAAVAEVEDGIRDFVRNDIAHLRRSNPGRQTPTHLSQWKLQRPWSTTSIL